ncbi:MAG: helix-turn-helix domain-containing protein [Planctomycetota bacterium]|jgi:transcriptional regulator with XRE-family HTH domain
MVRRPEEDISKMIRKLRGAFGLTQEQFAVKIGVTVATVNRWENSNAKPSPLAMFRIEELQKELKRNQ